MSTATMQPPSTSAPVLHPAQLQYAYAVCRGIARGAAKNFYYSFLALPKPKRNAICAVYAFMRHADDIVDDGDLPLAKRESKLAQWLQDARDVCSGKPTDDPVLYALSDAQHRFDIPLSLFEQLVSGTAMDLEPERFARFATFQDLYNYCYYVASVVGLAVIRIFGFKDPKAEKLAEQLGIAFQLTNIIRDVKEDAGLNRLYIPYEDLQTFGLSRISDSDLTAMQFQPEQWKALLEFQAKRAHQYYESSKQLLPLIAADSQPALWVLVTIYRNLLRKIEARQYDVFTERARLSFWEKSGVLLRGWIATITGKTPSL